MLTSNDINELAGALAKAQGMMEGAAKDGLNPHFKNKYPTLASVWDAIRKPLSSNGLSCVQACSAYPDSPERVMITTMLLHSSGQWMRDALTMAAGDGRPQSVGSAISYGRRYALMAMVGVAPEDDDAEATEGRAAPAPAWHVTTDNTEPPPWVTEPDTGLAAAAARTAKRVEAREETRGVFVESIGTKATKNPAVTKYTVAFSDGREASTIRDRIATLAKQACEARTPVSVRTEQGKYGVDLLDLVLLTEA